jgi:hypothetical protein
MLKPAIFFINKDKLNKAFLNMTKHTNIEIISRINSSEKLDYLLLQQI